MAESVQEFFDNLGGNVDEAKTAGMNNSYLFDIEGVTDQKQAAEASQPGLELEVQACAPGADVSGLDERAVLGDDDAPVGVGGLEVARQVADHVGGPRRVGERHPPVGPDPGHHRVGRIWRNDRSRRFRRTAR